MAKQDYARKRRGGNSASRAQPRKAAPKKAAPPPPRRKPWGLILFTPLVLGGLGFLLYTLLQTPPQPSTATTPKVEKVAPKPPPKPAAKPVAKAEPEPAPAAEEPKQSKFEFYEMLPKTEVVAPKVDVYKSTPKDAKMEHRYLLQAGSFRNKSDAESMRAKLILQGLPGVKVDQSSGSSGIWYRVRLGPFDNKTAMNKARNKLGKLSILPMQIRID